MQVRSLTQALGGALMGRKWDGWQHREEPDKAGSAHPGPHTGPNTFVSYGLGQPSPVASSALSVTKSVSRIAWRSLV